MYAIAFKYEICPPNFELQKGCALARKKYLVKTIINMRKSKVVSGALKCTETPRPLQKPTLTT